MTKKNRKTEEESEEEVEDVEDTDTEDTEEEESEDEESDDAEDEDDSEESDEDDESSEDDEDDDESDEEDESDDEDGSSTDDEDELDLDDELDKEKKRGKPDSKKAKQAFTKREKKRTTGSEGISEERVQEILAADRKERQESDALRFAKELAGSDKEAELIVAKWRNRTFPQDLSLREQIDEAYAITHRKRILGQRDEAMRALRGKRGIRSDSSSTHRKGTDNAQQPKLPADKMTTLRQSGLVWSNKKKRYQKVLANGRVLVYSTKTKQIQLLPLGQK